MTRQKFVARFEADAGVHLIGTQVERVIALAKLHTGSLLIEDIEVCREQGMGFASWLDAAEKSFPAAKHYDSGDLFESNIMQRLRELKKQKRRNDEG